MHHKACRVPKPENTKGHNSWSILGFYLKANEVIYSSLPIHSSTFKALASIVFELFCWQDFSHFVFQRAITQKRGTILMRKKYVSAIFSWGIHIWNFKILTYMVLKLCYALQSVTDERTEAICPSNFFEVGGITTHIPDCSHAISRRWIFSVNPEQTTPIKAVWSNCTIFDTLSINRILANHWGKS